MQLLFFCPRWGRESLPWDAFAQNVKAAGYDGVEYAISRAITQGELLAVGEVLAKHDLRVITQHYDTYEADFAHHQDLYSTWFEQIKPVKPFRIDSQTGKDFFTFEQNKALIDVATAFTAATGIAVFHETHRNKFSFAAHVTHMYLKAIPDLKITLDASHWVNVAESYLHDQPNAMQLAIERTEHIHARVGHPEGPQISDPRLPEWQQAVDVHLGWWDRVVARKRQEGSDALLTITPEFGPPPYLVTLPFTQQPIADQWDVNVFMMNLLKDRYQ
jgi:sugar phosphate isomerase/epimerase